MDSFSSYTHLIYPIHPIYTINCSQLPMQIHVHCTVSDSTSVNAQLLKQGMTYNDLQ